MLRGRRCHPTFSSGVARVGCDTLPGARRSPRARTRSVAVPPSQSWLVESAEAFEAAQVGGLRTARRVYLTRPLNGFATDPRLYVLS